MKRFLSAVLAVFLLALCGCGGGEPEKKVDERPLLRVGMECAYVPFNWESYGSEFSGVPIQGSAKFANGFDTKVAKKIADKLDRRLIVVKFSWNELLPALRNGEIDMIVAGMNENPEHEDIVYSKPYYKSNICVVVKKDGAYRDAESINDFQDAVIAAQSGTPHETLAGQMPYIKDECLYNDYDSMIAGLQNGEIDGYIAEFPVARANCTKYDNFTFVNLVNNETGFEVDGGVSEISVAIMKDNPLAGKICDAVAGFSESELEKLMEKCIDKQP